MPEKTALICEDEALISHWLAKEIASMGYDVVGDAPNGLQAVEMAARLKPDLVLMDIKMPEIDGIEATRRIMEESPAAIVMLTAYGDQTLVEQAIEAGASAYLVKPVSKQQLAPTLQMALTRFGQYMDLRNELSTVKATLETRKLVEKAKGLLMERGVSEEQAYVKMRKMSQDQSKPMKEVAQEIIHAAEILSAG